MQPDLVPRCGDAPCLVGVEQRRDRRHEEARAHIMRGEEPKDARHAGAASELAPGQAPDRVGAGPWYDRLGRLVAASKDDLHKKFKVTLLSKCINLTFKQTLGFKVFGGTGLSCVSPGDTVFTGSEIGPQRCAITKVEAYTPDMEKADKAAAEAAKAAAH